MRIGINLLYLIPNVVGGTQTYAESLIDALLKIDHDNEYFVFLNQECNSLEIPKAANLTRIVCNVRAERRLRRYAWEQLILPLKIRDYRLDLIHSLGYVGPLSTPCPSIVTIPDLNYVALRDLIPLHRRFALHFFSTRAARRAAHVITISNFSKTEIIRLIGVRPDKVTVTHLGPGWINDQSDSPQNGEITSAYGLPERYVVAFGGRVPHKNIPQLIKAFRKLDSSLPHSLVLLGHMPPNVDVKSLKNDPQSSQRIICLGYVPREHIHPILARADLYVLPSLYEGFGMPALEAQSCGVPMVCAAAASLPEVAGDGAIFFDPKSSDDMAGAMNRVLSDSGLQASLRERGERNVERFSWENTARSTLAVYQEVFSRSNPARRRSINDAGAAAKA